MTQVSNPPSPPWLLTPGPLSTSEAVRAAMLTDWGSWDDDFKQLTATICQRLVEIAGGVGTHVCVPVQGSGTFAVEAALGTLIGPDDKALVLANGAYGQRAGALLQRMGRDFELIDKGDTRPVLAEDVDQALDRDPDISHVIVIHCETSSGILNPLEAIAGRAAARGRKLIIDAMSSFGALPIDARTLPFTALISSANKCFEGVPGFGYAIVEETALAAAEGRCHSLSLDLHDQWRTLRRTGQWRYTPPTHVVAAFRAALDAHAEEGGVDGRLARYTRNRDRLVAGMRGLGFQTLLSDAWLSPIIVTFLSPSGFDFPAFYAAVKRRGFLLYPGKLTAVDSFRVGCIGQLHDEQIDAALDAIAAACRELGLEPGNTLDRPT